MRNAFIRALTALAVRDPRVLLLTADLGYTVVEPFAERFPDRFYNVGVAEQNMIGLATGLAEAGYLPFAYSIVTFAALRPYEFIRNGPVHHNLPVRIVGVGGGFEYGPAGSTHHGLEDVGVMRLQPRLAIMVPADHRQATTVLEATWDLPGPVYYRIGKDDKTTVPGLDGAFSVGRLDIVRDGLDVAIFTMGAIASEVVAAADLLADRGVHATVAIVSSIRPSPSADIAGLLTRTGRAITVEEHYAEGGLGSLVAEVAADGGLACRLLRCGVEQLGELTGSERYLRGHHKLTKDSIAERALSWLGL